MTADDHPRPVVLDVDTGIDDALALLLALRSPEVQLVGITTVAGNVPLRQVVENTLHVLATAGAAQVPVAVGAAQPLVGPLTTATFFHGPTGLGEIAPPPPATTAVAEPAPVFLTRLASQYRGTLTVIATGPLTNIALACRLAPDFGSQLRQLVVMGGAVTVAGNVTPVAEANIYNDPEAAQIVLATGMTPILIGLDVTHRVLWRPEQQRAASGYLRSLSAPNPVGQLAVDLLTWYLRADLAAGLPGSPLHDPLAVGAALWPELFTFRPMHVAVETAGQFSRGQTIGVPERQRERVLPQQEGHDVVGMEAVIPNARVALDVDAATFLDGFAARLGLLAPTDDP